MKVCKKQKGAAQGISMGVVWRNPLPHVRASLRLRQASNPYCRWAEQASKIRARQSGSHANHILDRMKSAVQRSTR